MNKISNLNAGDRDALCEFFKVLKKLYLCRRVHRSMYVYNIDNPKNGWTVRVWP